MYKMSRRKKMSSKKSRRRKETEVNCSNISTDTEVIFQNGIHAPCTRAGSAARKKYIKHTKTILSGDGFQIITWPIYDDSVIAKYKRGFFLSGTATRVMRVKAEYL